MFTLDDISEVFNLLQKEKDVTSQKQDFVHRRHMGGTTLKSILIQIWLIILRMQQNFVPVILGQLRREVMIHTISTAISPFDGLTSRHFHGNSGFQQYSQRFAIGPNPTHFRGKQQATGNNVICLYCHLPGHFAKSFPYRDLQWREGPATVQEATMTSNVDNRKQ